MARRVCSAPPGPWRAASMWRSINRARSLMMGGAQRWAHTLGGGRCDLLVQDVAWCALCRHVVHQVQLEIALRMDHDAGVGSSDAVAGPRGRELAVAFLAQHLVEEQFTLYIRCSRLRVAEPGQGLAQQGFERAIDRVRRRLDAPRQGLAWYARIVLQTPLGQRGSAVIPQLYW